MAAVVEHRMAAVPEHHMAAVAGIINQRPLCS
jgi:hypothetical protein